MTQFTQQLSNLSNSQGFCIEIGDGAWDSWFMPLLQQTESVCDQVKNMRQLANGYNILGLSQSGIFCKIADALIKSEIYSDYIQEHLAPSGYLKLPNYVVPYFERHSEQDIIELMIKQQSKWAGKTKILVLIHGLSSLLSLFNDLLGLAER
ncbi:palmitoyl-protein thioesterase 1-like protein [Tanacetum coccineum]